MTDPEALKAATPDDTGPGPFAKLVDQEWQTLLDKDDRNSPAYYPDMCLLTRTELAWAIMEGWELGRSTPHPADALERLGSSSPLGAGKCFECDHELMGPYCPACNLDLPQLSPTNLDRKRVARAIEDADAEFGYSMNLTRLVDGVSTYTLKIPDEPTTEHEGTDECYARIAEVKNRRRADAIFAAINASERVGEVPTQSDTTELNPTLACSSEDGEKAI